MPDEIRIVEVGPRDGLQNECEPIPLAAKLRFISALRRAGLNEIEATSFVSPKWVPQLADAVVLWPNLPPGPLYSALVPNLKGLERALSVGVGRIAVFTAASDTFTSKNINMTVQESLDLFQDVIAAFRAVRPSGWVRGYISTAFECPFEGRINPATVAEVAQQLDRIGVDEISVGDTVGVAVPTEVKALTEHLFDVLPKTKIAYHFHDTRGTAIANVATSLELGITAFDSSAGGLGGCPYAPGAGGNLATEDLVYFLQRSGLPVPIELSRLSEASLEILKIVGRQPDSKAQRAQLSASGILPT